MRIDRKAKVLCLILAVLLLLVCTSCGTSSKEKEYMQTIQNSVTESRDMYPDLIELVDWQISTYETMLEDKEAAEANGQEYTAPDYTAEKTAYLEMLEGHAESVQYWMDEVSIMETTDNEPVDSTIDAAAEYFDRLDQAIENLKAIIVFDNDVTVAQEPVTAFDSAAYTDTYSQLSALYTAMTECSDNLKAVSCPAYMQQMYDKYVDTITLYCTVLDQWYQAAYMGDNLRYAAATNMNNRVMIEEEKYGLMLYDDFCMQYQKVEDRLNGSTGELAEELIENTATLIDAM